jgi:hypothetical protein
MTNENTEAMVVQKTVTPFSVWTWIGFLTILVWGIWTLILTSEKGGLFLTLITLGVAISSGVIAVEIVDWHGVLIFNPWAKSRRVLFSGLHVKLPWEKVEEDGNGKIVLTSLMRTISSKETKPHPTNDPAENMETSLLIHIRVNTSGTSEDASDNFIRFRSIKEEALTEIVRVEVEKMFADYYGGQEMEALLKPHTIQEDVLGLSEINIEGTDEEKERKKKDEENRKKNRVKIKEMEKKYGVSIGVVLESSKPDKTTQDMKRTPARAEALNTAIAKLVKGGMDHDQARRAALILDPNTNYSEERFDLHVKGLENARDITMLGDPRKGDKK